MLNDRSPLMRGDSSILDRKVSSLEDKVVHETAIKICDVIQSRAKAMDFGNIDVKNYQKYLEKLNKDGPYEIRTLALLGACVNCFSGFFGLLMKIFTLNGIYGILSLYDIFFGFLIIMIEARDFLKTNPLLKVFKLP